MTTTVHTVKRVELTNVRDKQTLQPADAVYVHVRDPGGNETVEAATVDPSVDTTWRYTFTINGDPNDWHVRVAIWKSGVLVKSTPDYRISVEDTVFTDPTATP